MDPVSIRSNEKLELHPHAAHALADAGLDVRRARDLAVERVADCVDQRRLPSSGGSGDGKEIQVSEVDGRRVSERREAFQAEPQRPHDNTPSISSCISSLKSVSVLLLGGSPRPSELL